MYAKEDLANSPSHMKLQRVGPILKTLVLAMRDLAIAEKRMI